MKIRACNLNLESDDSYEVDLTNSFNLKEISGSILLEILVTPKFALSSFCDIFIDNNFAFRQYLMPKIKGKRLINLSHLNEKNNISIKLHGLKLAKTTGTIKVFNTKENLGRTLFIAPHPDDIEIGAFSLSYKTLDKFILTISNGESVKKLKNSYLPKFYLDLEKASLDKGFLRAFNARTTSLIYNTPYSNIISLGYPDTKLFEMYKDLSKDFRDSYLPKIKEEDSPFLGNDIVSVRKICNQDNFLSAFLNTQDLTVSGERLINELVQIIEAINPDSIVVTHPLMDSHLDHKAVGLFLGLALKKINHPNIKIFTYINHLPREVDKYFVASKNLKEIPFLDLEQYDFKQKFLSVPLSNLEYRLKANSFLLIPDLNEKVKLKKILKQKFISWLNHEAFYKANYYYLHDLKLNEEFFVIGAEEYIKLIEEISAKPN